MPSPYPQTVYFPLTVDDNLSLKTQTFLKTHCADLVGDINCEALPQRHQTRIWIYVKAAAYGVLLHAIILGLPSAEFGPLKQVAKQVAEPLPIEG